MNALIGLLLFCLTTGIAFAQAPSAAMAHPVSAQGQAKTAPVVKITPHTAKKTAPHAPASTKKPRAAATKTKERKESDVIATLVPKTKLDLRLPKTMVESLQPAKKTAAQAPAKPLLPAMFGEKPQDDGNFQLNGRLLSNEMKLNLRNEAHQEVDGAALEFQFKQ